MKTKKIHLAWITVIIIAMFMVVTPFTFAEDTEELYIPVLMYHHFANEGAEELKSLTVAPEQFEEQIQYLMEKGYTTISFTELYAYLKGEGTLPEKPLMITMDDGYSSNYEYAFPILQKYNANATIFISTNYVGMNIPYHLPHFTWEEAKEMEDSGYIDIQSHGHNHLKMDKINGDQVTEEVQDSLQLIKDNLGERKIQVFAYPYFRHKRATQKILEEMGVDMQVTKVGGLVTKNTPLNDIRRITVKDTMSGEDIEKAIEKIKKSWTMRLLR
jgi:peptidoglycan/xylan/chitin deacetylase (PgdA/CDA1 family)